MNTQQEMNITIPTHVIMAAMLVAAKDDHREYLNGMRLDKAAGQLAATNGHVLFTYDSLDLSSMEKSLTLPHFSLKGHGVSKGAMRNSTTIITQESDDELRVTIKSTLGQVICVQIIKPLKADRFPDISKVIAPEESLSDDTNAGFNPKYIKLATKIFKSHSQIRFHDHENNHGLKPAAVVTSTLRDNQGKLLILGLAD